AMARRSTAGVRLASAQTRRRSSENASGSYWRANSAAPSSVFFKTLVFAKPLEKPVRLGLIDDHELVARVVVGQDFRPGDVEPPGVQAQSPGLQALPHGRVAPEVF